MIGLEFIKKDFFDQKQQKRSVMLIFPPKFSQNFSKVSFVSVQNNM